MFYLSEIDHTLRLPPHLLNLPLDKAIKGELEGLFLDKVIPNLGLCISVYDIHSIDGGFIFPGDGASTYTRRLLKWERFAHFYRAVKLTENKGLFKWDTGYKVQQHGTMKQVLPAYSLYPKMIFPLFLSLLRMNFEQLFEVKFRLIMFRPFVGEVIAAKLKESTENGLRLSLGFFDDIYVPSPLMPSPSHHVPDPVEKNQVKWIWDYGASTDQNESSDDIEPTYTVERDEEIRFRVQDVVYQSIPILKADQKEEESKEIQKEKLKKFPPMLITGYLDADGLGLVGWWRG